MEKDKFDRAIEAYYQLNEYSAGIGTLSEKMLHSVVKLYIEPDISKHEIKLSQYFADIFWNDSNEVVEVQTREFFHIKNKLLDLLEHYTVNLVYPAPRIKWISWISPDTGDSTKKRKSPRTGYPSDALFELSRIKKLLAHPNLKIRVLMIDMLEYRNLDGWGADGKRGSSRNNRIPIRLSEDIQLDSLSDYFLLIPDNLPERFTVSDFAVAANLSSAKAGPSVSVLSEAGIIKMVGKQGRKYLYERI